MNAFEILKRGVYGKLYHDFKPLNVVAEYYTLKRILKVACKRYDKQWVSKALSHSITGLSMCPNKNVIFKKQN